MIDSSKTEEFFEKLESLSDEAIQKLVQQHLSDEVIEVICDHLEDYYQIQDDEEIGSLAQLVITGYLLAKSES